MKKLLVLSALCCSLSAAALTLLGIPDVSAADPARPNLTELQREVEDTEHAFAKTMADRDYTAFTSFLSDEAVFFSGPTPSRGKLQVARAWKRFYEKSEVPFSWAPEKVAVLDSGTLALSTGPVHDPKGNLIGTFTSIWRREAPGKWRIVFDKGCDVCELCSR
jgi:ketosteroid isomerase-like protein